MQYTTPSWIVPAFFAVWVLLCKLGFYVHVCWHAACRRGHSVAFTVRGTVSVKTSIDMIV